MAGSSRRILCGSFDLGDAVEEGHTQIDFLAQYGGARGGVGFNPAKNGLKSILMRNVLMCFHYEQETRGFGRLG